MEWDKTGDGLAAVMANRPIVAQQQGGGFDIETQAWECDKWPSWLHDIVDRTNEVADRLDMSTEQATAYAVLSALSPAEPGVEGNASEDMRELLRMIDKVQSRPGTESANGIYHPNSPMAAQVEKVRTALAHPALAVGVEGDAKPVATKEGDRVFVIDYGTVQSINEDDENAEVLWDVSGCIGDIDLDRLRPATLTHPSLLEECRQCSNKLLAAEAQARQDYQALLNAHYHDERDLDVVIEALAHSRPSAKEAGRG